MTRSQETNCDLMCFKMFSVLDKWTLVIQYFIVLYYILLFSM